VNESVRQGLVGTDRVVARTRLPQVGFQSKR